MASHAIPAGRIPKAELEASYTHVSAAQSRAHDIIAEAERQAAEALSRAESEEQRRKEIFETNNKTALRELISAKEVDAQIDAIVSLSLQSKRLKDEFEALKPWLVDFVIAAVKKVLGSLPKDELISGLVAEAVAMSPLNNDLRLKVHPDDKAAIKDAMAAHPKAFVGIADVLGDASLQPDTVLLEGVGGFMDISQHAQLSELRHHLENQFADASDDV